MSHAARISGGVVLAGVVILLLLSPWNASAIDVVHLKNGQFIEGSIVSGEGSADVVLKINGLGEMTLPAAQVKSIERGVSPRPAPVPVVTPGPAPAPVPAGEPARVTLKKSDGVRTESIYEGWVYELPSDKDAIQLRLADGSILRVPRERIAKQERIAEPAAAEAAAKEVRIATSHVILLKGGGAIEGNVLPSGSEEPLLVGFGDGGVLTLDRGRVESIEEKKGEIVWSTPAPVREEESVEVRIVPSAVPPELIEGLGEMVTHYLVRGPLVDSPNEMPPEILEAAEDLTRQRPQYRVRAENVLREAGPAALPAIAPLARSGFDLTRRAVMRLVNDYDDRRAAPIAIDGLNDPDVFVRESAHEALVRWLPEPPKYRADWPEGRRQRAQEYYRAALIRLLRWELDDAIVAQLDPYFAPAGE